MKILFVTHYDNLYGANKAMVSVIEHLLSLGNQILVAGPTGGKQLKYSLDSMGVKFIDCNMTQWQAVNSTPIRFLIKKLQRKPLITKEVKELYENVKDEGIDIVHSNSSVIVHGALLAEKLSVKHVWHIREFSKEHFNMKYFYKDEIVRELYNKADTLITISDSLMNNYKEKYPSAKIVRIYDGVDRADETDYYSNDSVTKFIYVGYLFEKKHQLELINACKKLYKEGYTDFQLHIVGEGEQKYKNKLLKAIDGLPAVLVQLRGYVENVNNLLDTMDVGIIASEYEGFGLVTVEYMLAKKAVIGRRHSATKEIVEDGITGILYDKENELIEAMKKLMDDRNMRKSMGEAGFERAKKHFSEESNIESICKIYKSVLS